MYIYFLSFQTNTPSMILLSVVSLSYRKLSTMKPQNNDFPSERILLDMTFSLLVKWKHHWICEARTGILELMKVTFMRQTWTKAGMRNAEIYCMTCSWNGRWPEGAEILHVSCWQGVLLPGCHEVQQVLPPVIDLAKFVLNLRRLLSWLARASRSPICWSCIFAPWATAISSW